MIAGIILATSVCALGSASVQELDQTNCMKPPLTPHSVHLSLQNDPDAHSPPKRRGVCLPAPHRRHLPRKTPVPDKFESGSRATPRAAALLPHRRKPRWRAAHARAYRVHLQTSPGSPARCCLCGCTSSPAASHRRNRVHEKPRLRAYWACTPGRQAPSSPCLCLGHENSRSHLALVPSTRALMGQKRH
ncbi:hypothetical protein C8R47DRAFT_557497 [Mycena vitilis]|nr:hypothetical protein C8R47DRAFT_557497 [Mycena vitilis]